MAPWMPIPLQRLSKDSQLRKELGTVQTSQESMLRSIVRSTLRGRCWMVTCVTCRLLLRGVHQKQARSRAISEAPFIRWVLSWFFRWRGKLGNCRKEKLILPDEVKQRIFGLVTPGLHSVHLLINWFNKHLLSTRQMCWPLETRR